MKHIKKNHISFKASAESRRRHALEAGPLCLAALLAALTALAPNETMAKPRSRQAMKAAAESLFGTAGMKVAGRGNTAVEELGRAGGYAVYGRRAGGFAVIATDDVAPAVLGYSDAVYDPAHSNPAFGWWLEAVDEVVSQAAAQGRTVETAHPDRSRHAASVPYICRSKWGQEEPYSDLCPTAGTGSHCLTGCVATAMAQILYFYRSPEHADGSASVTYGESPFTVNFSDHTFDWDNMRDTYSGDAYSAAEAKAVAVLMRDCGVASKMQYGSTVSLAYFQDAAQGLRKYFGIETAKYVLWENYDSQKWMSLIYDQLNEKMPVMYGGYDPTYGGHAFVVDGYDKSGRVHVNWGWNGSMDGYYDMSMLNPNVYSFAKAQDAVIDIKVEAAKGSISDTIEVKAPGTLATMISATDKYDYDTLKVSGSLDAADMALLREMAGRDASGLRTRGNMRVLDLRGATVGGGQDSSLPAFAFSGCTLTTILLPDNLRSIGDGAWAFCNRLDSVSIPTGGSRDYKVESSLVLSTDGSEVIAALPGSGEGLTVPQSVTTLRPCSFAGDTRLSSVSLPASVTSIGAKSFADCYGLASIKTYSKTVPTLEGDSVFAGINTAVTRLYVPMGTKGLYAAAAQWKEFSTREADNIVEFGSRLKVRNVSRFYGDPNPEFGYSITGDAVSGTPEMTCQADEQSPVGRYPIHISRGTVTDDMVEFEDGYLIVRQAPLTVTAADCTREAGQDNPEFALLFEGFKNGEDRSVLDEQPVATCEADSRSPEGEYPIEVSGGRDANYSFKRVAGTLTVTASTGIAAITGEDSAPFDVYAADGSIVASKVLFRGGVAGWFATHKLPKGIYIVAGRKYVVK